MGVKDGMKMKIDDYLQHSELESLAMQPNKAIPDRHIYTPLRRGGYNCFTLVRSSVIPSVRNKISVALF
jgi:hypothetical protein